MCNGFVFFSNYYYYVKLDYLIMLRHRIRITLSYSVTQHNVILILWLRVNGPIRTTNMIMFVKPDILTLIKKTYSLLTKFVRLLYALGSTLSGCH